MFCTKCGAKAIEGASFCRKCGAKLAKKAETQSGPESMTESVPKPAETPTLPAEPTSPPIETPPQLERMPVQEARTQDSPNQNAENIAEIYKILLENSAKCPAIKSAKHLKTGVSFRSGIFNYTVIIVKGQARMGASLAFPFLLLDVLAVYLIVSVALSIGWDLAEYGFLYFEDYAIQIIFGMLFAGLDAIVHTLAGRRSKTDVMKYVRDIVEQSGIKFPQAAKLSAQSEGTLR